MTAILTVEERMATAEANIGHLAETAKLTNDTVAKMLDSVGSLGKELAALSETLRHPSKDHCIMVDDIAEIKQLVTTGMKAEADSRVLIESRVDKLESKADRYEGGAKVLIAIIGGGNLLTIITIIGALAWLANKIAGK